MKGIHFVIIQFFVSLLAYVLYKSAYLQGFLYCGIITLAWLVAVIGISVLDHKKETQ